MATNVKISTIGARAAGGKPEPGQAAVDGMIEHWQGRFAQVLPDEPDLIVVPECCDRYPEHSMAQRQEYYRVRGDQIGEYFASVAREHSCYITYPFVREMPDGSSIILAVRLIFEPGTIERGPFSTPDPAEFYRFEFNESIVVRSVLIEAVETTGGNSGAKEIQFFEVQ